MPQQTLRVREAHQEEAQVAAQRIQGNDSGQPDGLRGQVFKRIHVCLPVGHVRLGVQDLLVDQVHQEIASGIARRRPEFRLFGKHVFERYGDRGRLIAVIDFDFSSLNARAFVFTVERRCDGPVIFVKEENKRLGGPFEVDIFANLSLIECQAQCLRAEK